MLQLLRAAAKVGTVVLSTVILVSDISTLIFGENNQTNEDDNDIEPEKEVEVTS